MPRRILPVLFLLPLLAGADDALLLMEEALDSEQREQQELEDRATDLEHQLRQTRQVMQRQDQLLDRLEAELRRLDSTREDG